MTLTVLDAVSQNDTVMFSPANTSPDLTTYEDGGYYFRTAPSDVLQGRVMGDLVISDGYANVGIMALQDPYGEGLAESVQTSLEDGGAEVAGGAPIIYDPNAANFATEVTQMKSLNPDAIVLIGFAETSVIIPELVNQGIGPQDVPLYFVDGNLSNSYEFPAGLLDGNKGTLPGAEATEEFQARMLEVNPELEDFSYGPESFDAGVLIALAAIAAGDDSGESIAANLVAVSKDGTKCTTFESAPLCWRTARTSTTTGFPARSSSAMLVTRPRPPSASTSTARTTSTPTWSSGRARSRSRPARAVARASAGSPGHGLSGRSGATRGPTCPGTARSPWDR